MEAEFDDFLKYLDFGSGFTHHGGAAGSRDDSGLSSISSDKSTSASPQDKIFSDFGGSSHSNSPQAAQLSFPGGPAAAPSVVFNDGFSSTLDGSNSSGASWGAISNQSNSPPFDASIYGSPVLQQQQNHRGSFDFNAFGNINLQSFTQPNVQQDLSPQLQLLLLQQAQLNMQTQAQNQSYQQSLPYQQQQLLHQSQPQLFQQQSYEQQYQQLLQQQQTQQPQHQAVPQLQSSDQQARRMSTQHTSSVNLAPGQGYPSTYTAPNGASNQNNTVAPVHPKAAESHLSLLPSNATQPLAPNMKKATLKRSYQQVKLEEDVSDQFVTVNPSQPLQRSTSQTTETASGEDAEPKPANRGGHNAVEQKYRRGINDSLIMLREIVPALGHLRAAPGAAPSKRKASQFSLAAAATPAAPSQLVDGVIPPKKLSKQLILVTATDYIRYLASRREELEGELNTLRQTLDECLEDSKLVFDLAENKFAPERARILTRRQEIYADRTSAKESKKRKLDGEPSGKKSRGNAKEASDEDSDDSGDEDEGEQEISAVSSAVPAKAQARGRGRPKKAAPTTTTSAGQPIAPSQLQQGPPKALLSIFGGISFIGGAGYDLLYGASSSAAASQPDTVNPARVWSHGLVRRTPVAVLPTHEDQLNSMQKFLISRPALLSGLVTFTLGLTIAYSLFYVVPQTYNRFTKSNRLAAKARARAALLAVSKQTPKQSGNERSALAILAGVPQSAIVQVAYVILLAIRASFTGAGQESKASAQGTAAVERAAASIKLLEMDNIESTSSTLQRLSSFLHLYVLLNSTQWPAGESTSDMSAQANAVLSLASTSIFGRKALSFANARWHIAQDLVKKRTETARPWLKSVLAMKHEELSGVKSLAELADRQYNATLLQAWQDLFSHVMLATNAAGNANEQPTSITQSVGTKTAFNEMLAILPASANRDLVLLYRGVEAMEVNDRARVIQIAVELSRSSSKSAGVQAYLDMVTGASLPDPPATFSSHSDCLAYVTVAWLRLRAATPASSQSSTKANDALQASALKVRKLLAEDVFDGTGSEMRFMEAQERCLEGLVRIGRQAAGLSTESDSGCEM